ncbi:50S ribosomal protein L33 [Candidatus Saccharibacteria bacterium]|nr:50S ribosomal protein L33 [Candidatus Saccharibacteria bacterium]MCB9821525.1 50S ribosomal protein L33 [Candidatus Nomurabacteria bacterium]
MAKSKSKRVLVGLVSQVTGHRRYAKKNTLNTPEPLVLNKYDPVARKVVEYKETKKNLGRNEVKPRKK